MTPKNEPIEKELNCIGYYGFGSGWQIAASSDDTEAEKRLIYCKDNCSVRNDCFSRHVGRTSLMVPSLVAEYEALFAACLKQSQDVSLEWARIHNGMDSPYSIVFKLNAQDGFNAGICGFPYNRGVWTIPWPIPLPS